jgi:hypothetical protein
MSSELPDSLVEELASWKACNDGRDIGLDVWIHAEGKFDLAVGYTTLFWPQFVLIEDYIVTERTSLENIRHFESANWAPQGIEWVLNHLHLSEIHEDKEGEATAKHLLWLGKTLTEIYTAKLKWQFPDRPCEVEFYIPDDPDDLIEYQVSFWQKKWEK